jgi:hypothetical protein
VNDMSRSVFAAILLLGFEATAQERAHAGPQDHVASLAPEGAQGREREARRSTPIYPGYIITASPGYFITPSGMVLFPDAPPPSGDTSTLGGAGPNVSTGPEVGSGPEVGEGPVVGTEQ